MALNAQAAIAAPDFQMLFEQAPSLYLVLDLDFNVLAASDVYLQTTLTRRESILGRNLFDIFPVNPDEPEGEGSRNLRISLQRVLATGQEDSMAMQKYDIPREDGSFEERYWSPTNWPVKRADGSVACIMHSVQDVSEFVRLRGLQAQAELAGEELQNNAAALEAEMVNQHALIARANTNLKESNSELARLNQQMRELDQMKTRFFANVSHELRTPLTLILGQVERFLSGQAEPGDTPNLSLIQRQARLLLQQVNDLLDVAKLDAGELRLRYVQLNLAELVRHVASYFDSLASDRDIVYQVEAPAVLPAQADAIKLQRVLLNLLSNAFKFTPDGGRIRIALEPRRQQAWITVQDTGPGVPAEMRDKVFERFVQVEDGDYSRHGGTGLGLAIVKEFVELHHGEVRLNAAEGGGALFRLELPLTAPAGVEVAPEDLKLDDLLAGGVLPLSGTPQSAVLPLPDNGAQPLVLLVEDNVDMSAFIAGALGRHYRVLTAPEGRRGMQLALSEQPDLIISDLMMPGMGGEALVAALRGNWQTEDIPVVMLSARADDALRLQMLQSSVQEFLYKPFSVGELLARVGRLIGERRRSALRLKQALYAAEQIAWELDLDDGALQEEGPVGRMFGEADDYRHGCLDNLLRQIHPEDLEELRQRWLALPARQGENHHECQFRVSLPDGGHAWVQVSASLWRDADGSPRRAMGFARDISALKRTQLNIEFLAKHDSLTQLPNRVQLNERLHLSLARHQRLQRRLYLLLVDLDDFRFINDNLGHEVGDQLLRIVAERLRACMRGGDPLFRIGGDEFVVLAEEADDATAAGLAERVLETLSAPYQEGDHRYFLSASIGISSYPADADSPEGLMRYADMAMYRAKYGGKNGFCFFAADMADGVRQRLQTETGLRQALQRGELRLEYQPQLTLRGQDMLGVEALLRWEFEGRKQSPAHFIGIAEKTGLIIDIDEYVFRSVCRQVVAWRNSGLPPWRISVNLSARFFCLPDSVARLSAIIAECGAGPEQLCLEITEGTLMDVDSAMKTLPALKRMGFHVSVDDFGTGFSSLSYLKRLPIDELKIDRSFIMRLDSDERDLAMVAAIVSMAESLGLQVLAEGVETESQHELLLARGCHSGQGYLYSPSLPPAQLVAWWRGRFE
ncbi:EAL domain-containing protein [Chromobacterium aquaticum]|uniref:histidine kinase n=1 Tax=Chromobacterium aquaticum TaxID=467180 RepID=A0ABV8ZPW2_9NEIS|nr:EAL domain-containing protein [Chromobacterium aquaticum]MCD5361789.1 EAL domain-containing protein [Chromobacterium aquaticum]